MTNQQHFKLLLESINDWNKWREKHPEIFPDLSFANLSGANLTRADLTRAGLNGAHLSEANLIIASLSGADLSGADLSFANLSYASLSGASLSEANLTRANLSRARLSFANLSEANLYRANLSGADLSFANLSRATLVRTNLAQANLTDCQIYGISAWDIQLKEAKQNNLVITHEGQPTITVDNLEVAQFIYLLLNNTKIRDVINTLTTKVVLILGRFTPERKAILDALRDELRQHNYLPVLFDFEKPSSQDFTETVSTLAHLSRFIIADLTDPSCSPYEIGTIAHNHIK